jgi:AcrR family transcriptional regulator
MLDSLCAASNVERLPIMAANRQVERTRNSIQAAFRRLVFSKSYHAISMTEVAHAANVGRSTLYTHFRERDAILVAAIQPVLLGLARSVCGPEALAEVTAALEHLWSQRGRGRLLIVGATGAKLEAALAAEIQHILNARRGGGASVQMLSAQQVASSVFAACRSWLRGDVSMRVAALASHMCATSAALCDAVRAQPPDR